MASDQPTSAASPASPGNERSTSPTTASSTGPAAVATTIESPTPTPIWRARETGRITDPPASIAASAAVRSPTRNVSRPSAAKSEPRIATASRRVPSKARSNEAIGVARATPSIAAISGP